MNIPEMLICHAKDLNFQCYTVLTYFCKYVRVLNIKYVRVLNIAGLSLCPGFWISRVTLSLPIFVNMTGFWICVGMQLRKGSANASIMQGSELAWIWLNNAWINCSDCGRIMNWSFPGQSFIGLWTCFWFWTCQGSE